MKLTKIKGFIPYLIVVFCNGFVDLGHKILVQDTLYKTTHGDRLVVLTAIINSFILLPYLLLFTPSGFLSDKYTKARMLRITAAAVVPLTLMITFCYYQGYFWAAFMMTLLLGAQSAVNSPAKYGYIKELCGKSTLAAANAWVQTTAVIAILSGTFIFSYFFEHLLALHTLADPNDMREILHTFAPLGWLLVLFSLIEAYLTWHLPESAPVDSESEYDIKQYFKGNYLKPYLKRVFNKPMILACVIGLAIFSSVNQVLLSSYGPFVKATMQIDSVLFSQGMLALGGVGLLFGANYAGRVSRGFIETGMIPVAACGIAINLFLLPILSSKLFIGLLFFTYGFFGGMLIVPLNALIQFNSGETELGKILAGSNFIQYICMFFALMLTIAVSLMFKSEHYLLYGLFLCAFLGFIWTLSHLKQSLVRYLLYVLVSKVYRLQVQGLDNIPSRGGVLLLGNHTSLIDWAILQLACPRPIRFVMEKAIYDKWYLTWILKRFKVIPISKSHSKAALENIQQYLSDGEVVVIFPEGRLSMNGQLGKFYSGFERAVVDTNTIIIPFYVLGLWGAKSSYAPKITKQIKKRGPTEIMVTFGQSLPLDSSAIEVRQKVKELSISSWHQHVEQFESLPYAWLKQAKQHISDVAIVEDKNNQYGNNKLIAAVWYFRRNWAKLLKKEQNIGLLLPASAGSAIANLGVLCLGKCVVNLNYTVGVDLMLAAMKKADIKTIITSRLFVMQVAKRGLKLDPLFELGKVIYLEDYRRKRTKLSIVKRIVLSRFLPFFVLKHLMIQPAAMDSTAAILFSSGSEGTPKGVELTHRNLLCNIKQMVTLLSLTESDVVLSILPTFHAFGLTTTTLMPLLQGVPMVCFPDPSNIQSIAKLIFKNKVTLMCQTPTFLNLYIKSKKIHPAMLQSLRLVIAGAEKLQKETYLNFKDKFNMEVYEGYGATEVAPVASCNFPDVVSSIDMHVHEAHKQGTVGLPLPGSAFRVVDPETYEMLPQGEEGMVLIGGTQVMKGYLKNPQKTNQSVIEKDSVRWYITGDKGFVDDEGFLTLIDRYSRFAKIAGEMVSLSAVEQSIMKLASDNIEDLMVVNLPSISKGEQLVLFYSGPIEPAGLVSLLKASELNRFMFPKDIEKLEELPRFGSGKKNYVKAKEIAKQLKP